MQREAMIRSLWVCCGNYFQHMGKPAIWDDVGLAVANKIPDNFQSKIKVRTRYRYKSKKGRDHVHKDHKKVVSAIRAEHSLGFFSTSSFRFLSELYQTSYRILRRNRKLLKKVYRRLESLGMMTPSGFRTSSCGGMPSSHLSLATQGRGDTACAGPPPSRRSQDFLRVVQTPPNTGQTHAFATAGDR